MTRTEAFNVGDKVRFNNLCGSESLLGETAVVTAIGRTRLSILLDRPIGRFVRTENGIVKSVEVQVPPTVVDHVI